MAVELPREEAESAEELTRRRREAVARVLGPEVVQRPGCPSAGGESSPR
ncbi:MAG TPA: hypothetical protein VHQ90_01920 [Thermoanaerobaculia bacterium]|nr:hypothetical protein [Thermoanaerobaculia bacterium]